MGEFAVRYGKCQRRGYFQKRGKFTFSVGTAFLVFYMNRDSAYPVLHYVASLGCHGLKKAMLRMACFKGATAVLLTDDPTLQGLGTDERSQCWKQVSSCGGPSAPLVLHRCFDRNAMNLPFICFASPCTS